MIEFNGLTCSGENPEANLEVRTKPNEVHLRKRPGVTSCTEGEHKVLVTTLESEDANLHNLCIVISPSCQKLKNNQLLYFKFRPKQTEFNEKVSLKHFIEQVVGAKCPI